MNISAVAISVVACLLFPAQAMEIWILHSSYLQHNLRYNSLGKAYSFYWLFWPFFLLAILTTVFGVSTCIWAEASRWASVLLNSGSCLGYIHLWGQDLSINEPSCFCLPHPFLVLFLSFLWKQPDLVIFGTDLLKTI